MRSSISSPRHWVRVGFALVVLCSLACVACGGTNSTTTTSVFSCPTDFPQTRYWMRDILAVTIGIPSNVPSDVTNQTIDSGIYRNVGREVQSFNGSQYVSGDSTYYPTPVSYGLTQSYTVGPPKNPLLAAEPFVRFPDHATAFYQITPSNSSNVCDGLLLDIINTFNAAVAKNAEKYPITVDNNGDQVYIIGFSPDWIVGGAPGGDENSNGRPDGPPGGVPISSPPDPTIIPTSTDTSAGTGTTVYVLDEAYDLGTAGAPHQPSCGTTPVVLAPFSCPLPLIKSAEVAQKASSDDIVTYLGKDFQEIDAPVDTDVVDPAIARSSTSPAPNAITTTVLPYELTDVRGSPLRTVDHGIFVSTLIYHEAPGANIVLIRALNDYGVGDLASVLSALQLVQRLQSAPGAPARAIVNMSLSVGLPTSCLPYFWRNWDTLQQTLSQNVQAQIGGQAPGSVDPSKLTANLLPACKDTHRERTGDSGDATFTDAELQTLLGTNLAIQAVKRDTNGTVAAVVAAAGNDSPGGGFFDADAPAAYCGVVAVGAKLPLGDGYGANKLADFSNAGSVVDLTNGNAPSCFSTPKYTGLPLDAGTWANNPPAIQMTLQALSSGDPLVPSIPLGAYQAKAVGVRACGLYLQNLPQIFTVPGQKYYPHIASWQGTSFAAPLVSGALARGSVSIGNPRGVDLADEQLCQEQTSGSPPQTTPTPMPPIVTPTPMPSSTCGSGSDCSTPQTQIPAFIWIILLLLALALVIAVIIIIRQQQAKPQP